METRRSPSLPGCSLRQASPVIVSMLLMACAPEEVVTTYDGSIGANAQVDREPRPGFILVGVPLRVARAEGSVTRVEFSAACAVAVSKVGDALVPAAGQTCAVTIGRYGPWQANGFVTTTTERTYCTPATLTLTELSPSRVAAQMQCQQIWEAGGSTHRLDVTLWFMPRAA